jgi:hypothetical protein
MRVVPQYKEFADNRRKLAASAKSPEHKKQLFGKGGGLGCGE